MLPDFFEQGQPRTLQTWQTERRGTLHKLFARHVYGETPKELPTAAYRTLSSEVVGESGITMRTIETRLSRGGKACAFRSRLFLPKKQQGPLPVVLMINPFSKNPAILGNEERERQQMPFERITAQGFAAVHADVDEACPDNPEQYQNGLLTLYPPEGESGRGAIGAWAFLASRLIDHLATLPEIDASRIAVCGCSRAGKAALWCAAQDERIALIISNVSGCTGAAITRGKTGERIADITSRFPHWLCKAYAAYAHREEDLPVDQHQLLALLSPRPLYVSSASEDTWADPAKEYESLRRAGEIYGLYGLPHLDGPMPPPETPVTKGATAYHSRVGEHGCRYYDWDQYLAFMARSFGAPCR